MLLSARVETQIMIVVGLHPRPHDFRQVPRHAARLYPIV